ncbi:MAG: DegQ family serine endoprotease [Alphaproteobacteria bacterium]|nr:DegQ family serine endoprotease [Alphaproteobacteria bacterium]
MRWLSFLLLVLSAAGWPAASQAQAPVVPQTRAVPESRQAVLQSFSPLVRRAAPAVVNIFTRKVVRERPTSPLMNDPFFRRFFGDQLGDQPREQSSLGSGVILRKDGVVVTNHHVIRGADEIRVVLSDRRELEAKLVGSDERTDLAVLRIEAPSEGLPTLELGDSDGIEVGDLVLAIGNPFGVGQTVTSGIVSATARTMVGISDYRFFIQTDAAINPGNSGGALLSMDGKVIGINTAIYSQTGGSVGIGFAIPANMVRAVVTGLVDGGKVVRPWFGASGQPVGSDVAASLGLTRPSGVILEQVAPNSPAARAGLKVGDVITSIDGREVEDAQALRFRIGTLPIGGRARLGVIRQGIEQQVFVALEAAPESPPRQLTPLTGRHPFSGATVANLSPALAEELGLETASRGVIIMQVRQGTIAQRLGVTTGDIVLKVNDTEIVSVDSLRRAVSGERETWQLSIKRRERVMNVRVRG